MRAIVLLCLLHAVAGQSYSWDGTANSLEDPMAGSACRTDQGSCGCCMMLQKVDRMQAHFDTSLSKLERMYREAEETLTNIETHRAAFVVTLYNSTTTTTFFGPFDFNTAVRYDHVFLNLGEGYNPETGMFTVPYSGVYSLAFTAYSDAGAPGQMLAICVSLQIDDQLVAGYSDRGTSDQEDAGTNVVALYLKAGNKVSVTLLAGCFINDDNNHYNTFSGFLLYPTE